MLPASVWRSAISFVVLVTNPRVTVALTPAHRAASDLARMPWRASSARVLRSSTAFFQPETAESSRPRSISIRSVCVSAIDASPASLLEVLVEP